MTTTHLFDAAWSLFFGVIIFSYFWFVAGSDKYHAKRRHGKSRFGINFDFIHFLNPIWNRITSVFARHTEPDFDEDYDDENDTLYRDFVPWPRPNRVADTIVDGGIPPVRNFINHKVNLDPEPVTRIDSVKEFGWEDEMRMRSTTPRIYDPNWAVTMEREITSWADSLMARFMDPDDDMSDLRYSYA